jgi:hypothetical protein
MIGGLSTKQLLGDVEIDGSHVIWDANAQFLPPHVLEMPEWSKDIGGSKFMTNWQEWANLIFALVVAGPVTALLTQLIVRANWKSRIRWAVAIALSVLVGIAQVWLVGDVLNLIDHWGSLTANDVIPVVVATYIGATGFYNRMFKDSEIATKILNT